MDELVSLSRAEVLINTKRFRDAEKLLKDILSQYPECGDAHAYLSICYSNMNLHNRAVEEAKAALSASPDYSYYHYILSLAYFRKEDYALAEKYIKSALVNDPENDEYYHILGSCYLNQGNNSECEYAIHNGLRINPNNSHLLELKSRHYNNIGDLEQAERFVKISLKESPNDPNTLARKGWISMHNEQYKNAEKEFSEALRIDPFCGEAKEGLVEIYKLKSRIFNFFIRNSFKNMYYEISWWRIPLILFLIKLLPIWLFLVSAYMLVGWYLSVLFNTFLRLRNKTKYLLTEKQILQSNVFTAFNGLIILSGILAHFTAIAFFWKVMLFLIGAMFMTIGTMQLLFKNSRINSIIFSTIFLLIIVMSAMDEIYVTAITTAIVTAAYGLGWTLRIKAV
ncbi:MAG: tetratricopeptide repeat protein [Cytophagaceae bacterium]